MNGSKQQLGGLMLGLCTDNPGKNSTLMGNEIAQAQ